MPVITLPDGSKKVFEKSVTVLEIAQSIGAGLAKATIAGKVNDVLLDATLPIDKDAEVVIITSKDKEGVEIIRHSFAHLIGCLLYTSPSPRDPKTSRMPSSA